MSFEVELKGLHDFSPDNPSILVPILYTDIINGQQVSRDDLWLCSSLILSLMPTRTKKEIDASFDEWRTRYSPHGQYNEAMARAAFHAAAELYGKN